MFKFLMSFMIALSSFNVQAAVNDGSAIAPATYVGYVSELGDLGWVSNNYRASHRLGGEFSANVTCDNAYAGSRAALYDDFKYIISDLPSGNYFILDAIADYDLANNKVLFKNGRVDNVYSTERDPLVDYACNKYQSATGSYEINVLDTSPGISAMVLSPCNATNRIACVTD